MRKVSLTTSLGDGDDVYHITESKDNHQLVEIVPRISEPEYDEDVPNDS